MTQAPVLQVLDLHKRYGEVIAVDGVSFSIAAGTCFGLLGPNGAGKTTTVEIMEGIMSPTAGEVLYQGRPLDRRFREDVGIQFQTTALQEFLTVDETLRLFHRFYENVSDLSEVIETCALTDLLKRDNRRLSGGQRQRLLLAIALLNDPRVLFLDEPTTGLDPQSRRNFWQLIERIKEEKKTIVLTTHYMEEAYRLCEEIIIMDHGKVIAQGPPAKLLVEHFDDSIVQLPAEDFNMPVDQFPFTVLQANQCVEISTKDVDDVIKHLLQHGVSLKRLQIRPRTLDDLFLELTGKELRA